MTEQDFQEVVRFLEETPGHVRQLVAEMALQDLKWKPSVNEFSVVEQVCHLRDLEREGYSARIKKLLTEKEPALPDFDGSRIARERDYNSQDFESAFEEFALARAENVRVMKTLSLDQLNRSGVLEGVGAITLGKLFWLMREHDQSHREELSDLRDRISAK
jgi:DinB superfamily